MKRKGITLIEIVIVIALMTILSILIGSKMYRSFGFSMHDQVKTFTLQVKSKVQQIYNAALLAKRPGSLAFDGKVIQLTSDGWPSANDLGIGVIVSTPKGKGAESYYFWEFFSKKERCKVTYSEKDGQLVPKCFTD